MNLKSPLRRTAAIAAGALIGLTGVVAFAGPASAHHPIFNASSPCVNDDGTWQVTWTIGNSESHKVGTITDVKLTPATSTITNIQPQATLLEKGKAELEGVQTLAAADEFAQIQISVEWPGAFKTDSSQKVSKPTEKCNPTTPTPTPTTTSPSPTPTVTTPPTTTPTTTPPTTTPPASPTPTPSATDSPVTEPEFVYEETCDTVTVGITIPKDWKDGDITVVFTTSEGDSKTIVGKVGETTTVEFKAVDGMKITATPEGFEGEGATITYEQPADCDTAGGGGSDEPSLPLTGAAAGSIAGGAAALLAIGAVLFVMARRRRVKFTA